MFEPGLGRSWDAIEWRILYVRTVTWTRDVKFMCIRKQNINAYINYLLSRRWNNNYDINQWLIKPTRKTTEIILISFYCIIIFDLMTISFLCRFKYSRSQGWKAYEIILQSKTSLSWLKSLNVSRHFKSWKWLL